MEQYNVTGMSCAACAARVEKAVNGVEGVTSCSVSLLTNSMGVEGTADPAAVISAVTNAGYGASVKGAANSQASTAADEDALADHETPLLKKRLIWSVGFVLVLMYFSMGHMMGLPMPGFFHHNPVANGLIQLLLAAIVMVINQKFFVNGFKGLLHRSPNMDTLVALGSAASFGYSTVILFLMTEAQRLGDAVKLAEYQHEFYFESAAMILALITVGKMLEARSKGKTTDALKSLLQLRPKTATVERDGALVTVPIDGLHKGDVFVVKPGEHIPADGVVIDGTSAVDEAALTGESIPVDKTVGDAVSAATVNRSGLLRCEATKVGEDTTLSQIIQMVSDAAATKAPIAKAADKVSGVFVPIVISIAVLTIAIWLLAGQTFGYALARGISVLVISCPCALGLATPVAIMVGNGVGAKHGILFKNAVSLEQTGKTQIVVLDKTGTVTVGDPQVTDLLPAEGISEEELLTLAAAVEQHSEHPLSKAVLKSAEERSVPLQNVTDFTAMTGNGVSASLHGKTVLGGKRELFSDIPAELIAKAEALAEQGKTPLYFGEQDRFYGIIAVADVVKEDSAEAIAELKKLGMRVVMLTGDNQKTADAIGKQVGADEVIAGVLPQQKGEIVRRLKANGKVMMVGDGINDAPALTEADIGAAIGAGTDVAIDAADVVLMKSRLSDVVTAIRLSKKTLRNIHENLFWAFCYNVIGIPLAAGAWIPLLGWELNPMFGAAAMSLSSFCVVTNALRLNFFKAGGKQSTDDTQELTMEITGMMCEHCEHAVETALLSVKGVIGATASHKKGCAVITVTKNASEKAMTKAVTEAGYKVVKIK